MKISEKSLRKIIKESIQEVLGENGNKLSIKWAGHDKLIPEILDSLKKYKKDIIIRLDGPSYIKKGESILHGRGSHIYTKDSKIKI